MDQVLLLLFSEFFPNLTKLLDADQEKNSLQVRFFTESLNQFRLLLPPSLLKIVVSKHSLQRYAARRLIIEYRLLLLQNRGINNH